LLNSIYSSVSPDFRFKETPYVNFFTDLELSSSLYKIIGPRPLGGCAPLLDIMYLSTEISFGFGQLPATYFMYVYMYILWIKKLKMLN